MTIEADRHPLEVTVFLTEGELDYATKQADELGVSAELWMGAALSTTIQRHMNPSTSSVETLEISPTGVETAVQQ